TDLALPLLLYAPGLVRDQVDVPPIPVNLEAIRALEPLVAEGHLVGEALMQNSVRLENLFMAWAEKFDELQGASVEPASAPIPGLGPDGTMATGDRNWKQFDSWVRRQARTIARAPAAPRPAR